MSSDFSVVLIGDSDIQRWPPEFYPEADFVHVSAVSGATLQDCVALVPEAVQKGLEAPTSDVFVVACAGENDIAQCTTLNDSVSALSQFLAAVFASEQDRIHLIFLGPKLEPWLSDDKESRRDYIRMSRAFEKICSEHAMAERITFLDCLVMFCGQSAYSNGALLGGKANAEKVYFDYDMLHLSPGGYGLWKQKVDEVIKIVLVSES